MAVVAARQVPGAVSIGKRTNQSRGTCVLRRGLPRLILEHTVHRLPYEFRDGNALPSCDHAQAASLIGGELHLCS